MESSEDKQWASKYLLDPLTAPEPSQETGPGTNHNVRSNSNGQSRPPSIASRKTIPTSKISSRPISTSSHNTISTSKNSGRPVSNASTSVNTRGSTKQGRNTNGNNLDTNPSSRRESNLISNEGATSQRSSSEIPTSSTGRRRNSSLYSRFDGDQSHKPLEIIKRDLKLANRAPHLRKKHHVGADTIDSLDAIGGGYHHEGPYDATLLAKNTSFKSSPLEAVRNTNLEALKATPREMIQDSIQRHRPLDGVAIIPPGIGDRYGRKYNYQEGADMMIEDGGNYKRWPGVDYHPDDLKGKGEPSYSIEKALKDHKTHSRRRAASESHVDVEMTAPRPASSDSAAPPVVDEERYADWAGTLRRNSTGRGEGGGGGVIRKRFESLRRK